MADSDSCHQSPSRPRSELSTIPNTPRTESPEPGTARPVDATRSPSQPRNDSGPTPRTPGVESPPPAPVDLVNVNALDASPSSTSSGENRYDIQPTWPKMIDVTKAAAVATWKKERMTNLFLDLHWHIPSNKAFFKLRATVPLAGVPGRRDGKTSVYLFIHPERIRQLRIDHNLPGSEAMSFKFVLERAPALIVPKTPFEPKNPAAKQFLDAFRALATQTCFDVCAEIPPRKLSASQTQELCAVVSGQEVASLAAHANANRLYQGRGGQIIEGCTLTEPSIVSDTSPALDEPPPQYTEPRPASSSKTHLGQKRRRRSSSGSSSTEKLPEPMTHSGIQSLLDRNMSLLKKHVDDALALHRQEVRKDVAEQVSKAEARILETLRDQTDRRCDEIQDYLDDRIYQEMAEVEDNVMRNLTEAPLQATLTFPLNPWY